MRKEGRPEEQRIDRVHVEDVEFDELRRDKVRPRTDSAEVSRKQVSTEKVTVSRREITRAEETEKPKYLKDQDIGRIVIEEIPEKTEVPKSDVSRKVAEKPKSAEVTVKRHEVEEVPRMHVKEDVIKVGQLDVTDLEKAPVESRRLEERVATYREKVEGARKV